MKKNLTAIIGFTLLSTIISTTLFANDYDIYKEPPITKGTKKTAQTTTPSTTKKVIAAKIANKIEEQSSYYKFGAYYAYGPKFEGSNRGSSLFIPLIDIKYKDIIEYNRLDGLLVSILSIKNIKLTFGANANFIYGRKASESSLLRGSSNINPTMGLGIYAKYTISKFDFIIRPSWELFNSRNSFTTTFSSYYTEQYNAGAIKLKLGAHLVYGDSNYMDKKFGISPRQASETGLRQFRADGGISNIAFTATSAILIGKRISFETFGYINQLLSDAYHSPLSKAGDPLNVYLGIGISYTL